MLNETIISPIIDIDTKKESNKKESNNECPICFEQLENSITMKCCSHQVCRNCYTEWHFSLENPSCAFCRTDGELICPYDPPNMEIDEELQNSNHNIVHTICPTLCIFGYLTSACIVYALVLTLKK